MAPPPHAGIAARRIHVRGVVQGVGFRPFVYRLAQTHAVSGWVLNRADGVAIHVEGQPPAVDAFIDGLAAGAPAAARIVSIAVGPASAAALTGFEIRGSESHARPTTRVSPDLPVCSDCLDELFDPADRRFGYAYINCSSCGPRYSIVERLPYDRVNTTMAPWVMCDACAREYHDPANRRFHAQPVACPACGPAYRLIDLTAASAAVPARGTDPVGAAARLLRDGRVVAIKGIGGYHLACNADSPSVVAALRERKYRKERAFALMVRDLAAAERTVVLTADARRLLESPARPIVLAPARADLPGVAPDNRDLGVMLPYAPLHALLFDAGAPERLVLTSGNRASEPIAYLDADALRRLTGIADAALAGERSIARRLDDSVVRAGALGPVVLRRSRGLAPGVAAQLPRGAPILALGADLKNAVTLVVDGQAYVSQHIGDLDHHDVLQAFERTVQDLIGMYEVDVRELTVVHDAHPEYASTARAAALGAERTLAVQHHRAHVASVLAERGELQRRVIGIALDGTGYGDDGSIWGGEVFAGSVAEGFERVAHLHPALLPGGDAAARHPVQAAAGFLSGIEPLPDLTRQPFAFPERYRQARALARSRLRTFPTTSAGRLFDTVAALTGFTRPVTFEGQAAMWLEHRARQASADGLELPMPFTDDVIDWRGTLRAIVAARLRGAAPDAIARAFHRALARGLADAARTLAARHGVDTLVLSGGVMQNALLLEDLCAELAASGLQLWTNRDVPPNDGGISLGQAAQASVEVEKGRRGEVRGEGEK